MKYLPIAIIILALIYLLLILYCKETKKQINITFLVWFDTWFYLIITPETTSTGFFKIGDKDE